MLTILYFKNSIVFSKYLNLFSFALYYKKQVNFHILGSGTGY